MDYSYSKVAQERMRLHNDPKKAQESVDLLDSMILTSMMHAHPDKYWAWRRADHQLWNGAHYDEAFALWEVSQMHHKSSTGTSVKGEHWDLATVQSLMPKYSAKLAGSNVYDLYVALNGQWHDYIEMFKKMLKDEALAEQAVIDSAIEFYFMDADAPDGKVWLYHEGMRKIM